MKEQKKKNYEREIPRKCFFSSIFTCSQGLQTFSGDMSSNISFCIPRTTDICQEIIINCDKRLHMLLDFSHKMDSFKTCKLIILVPPSYSSLEKINYKCFAGIRKFCSFFFSFLNRAQAAGDMENEINKGNACENTCLWNSSFIQT